MNILDGIKNFLNLINDNWTSIIVIIGLCVVIKNKASDYFKKSDDEKIAIEKYHSAKNHRGGKRLCRMV